MLTLSTTADATWGDPSVDGIERVNGEWELDLAQYEDYIEDTTNIKPTPELNPEDCYRIGNLLESILDAHYSSGRWPRGDPAEYSAIDSEDTVVWLARFFRQCHEACQRSAHSHGDADSHRGP